LRAHLDNLNLKEEEEELEEEEEEEEEVVVVERKLKPQNLSTSLRYRDVFFDIQ
jgi:hypothetical protein